MGRWLRQYNVYRFLGLLPVLIVAVMWLFNMPMPIQWQGEALPHEPLLVVLGIVGTLLTYFFPRLGETPSGSAAPASTQSAADRNRADLLDAVDQIWLKGLLDNLLNQDKDFQIKLAFLQPEKVAQQYGGEPYPLKDNRAALQTFEDFGRRLVLLGEPGAGKTVLLLQLARQLHAKALADASAGIPVIFPLSSWAQKQLPFHQWLQGELRDRYGASKTLAENLVAGERLIYLLDGLDEVNAEQREDCLKAIKAFVEAPNRRIEYMLCSRRAEFMALETRLAVPGEIVLQPLSWEAIQHYIQGDEFAALRTLLKENAILREDFARIPFMLNTMAYVTQRYSIEKARLALAGKTDAESLQAYFLDNYLTKRFRERAGEKYPSDKSRHWLSWLAQNLIEKNETDFFLENMQPEWLNLPELIRQWKWRNRITFGIIMFLIIFNILYIFTINLSIAALGGVLGLIGGIWIWFVFEETLKLDKRINIVEGVFSPCSWTCIQLIILIGPIAILKIVIKVISVGIREARKRRAETKDSCIAALIWMTTAISIPILFGIVATSIAGPVVGIATAIGFIVVLFTFGIELPRLRSIPGSGIQRSLSNGLFFTFFIAALLTPVFPFAFSGLWIIASLLIGIMIGIRFGLGAYIQHYTLRHMLANAGHLPRWRYDKFLDYAAQDLLILRKVGGGYRFTHDYLRQHLAASAWERSQG